MADKLDDKGFLQRWSTRKADAREGGDVEVMVAEEVEAVPASDEAALPADLPAPELPDVETLGADSDYTGFLGDNVPQDLAKVALRKLWRSDPVFASLDGLNDYDDDFSKGGMVAEVVKTAYRVGKGLLTDEEFAAENGAAAVDAEEGAAAENEAALNESCEDSAPDTTEGDAAEGEGEAVEFHNAEFTKP